MILDTQAMSLSAAARRLPGRHGGCAHPSTVSRFVNHGVRLPNGQRVKLKATRCGATVFVTEQALLDFIAAMNPVAPNEPAPQRTAAERDRAAARACRELELAGA
jgi:hypothetical protein